MGLKRLLKGRHLFLNQLDAFESFTQRLILQKSPLLNKWKSETDLSEFNASCFLLQIQ